MDGRERKLEAFSRLLDVQERLRKECPWDRKQTFESLRPHTIEEVYELADALMNKEWHEVRKELGDVMEHVVFYALLGEEAGVFDMADVCNKEADKLMFRHPFIDWTGWKGNPKAEACDKPMDADAVEVTWEQVKQKEKDGNKTVLSGVPASLPALIKAYRIQDKARNVGFDWEERTQVWDKVREELGELEVELEKGVIVALRHIHLNPEQAKEAGVADKDVVSVKVGGERGLIFDNVLIRSGEAHEREIHLDTDEGNAAGLKNDVEVEILK